MAPQPSELEDVSVTSSLVQEEGSVKHTHDGILRKVTHRWGSVIVKLAPCSHCLPGFHPLGGGGWGEASPQTDAEQTN